MVQLGQPIACVHHVCAWLTMPCPDTEFSATSAGMVAYRVKELAGDLAFRHGCSRCGNVALVWPDDVAGSELSKKEIWCTGSLKFDSVREDERTEYCGADVQNGLCDSFQVEVKKAKKAEVQDAKKRLERMKKVHKAEMKKLKEKAMEEAKEELMKEYEEKMKAKEEAKKNDGTDPDIETRSSGEREEAGAVDADLCSSFKCLDSIGHADEAQVGTRPEIHGWDADIDFFHDLKKKYELFKEEAPTKEDQVKEAGKAVRKMGVDIALQKANEAIAKVDQKIKNGERSPSPQSNNPWRHPIHPPVASRGVLEASRDGVKEGVAEYDWKNSGLGP